MKGRGVHRTQVDGHSGVLNALLAAVRHHQEAPRYNPSGSDVAQPAQPRAL